MRRQNAVSVLVGGQTQIKTRYNIFFFFHRFYWKTLTNNYQLWLLICS